MTKQTPQTSISARQAACREVVTALRISANDIGGLERFELLALAHRINLCGLNANYFICDDAINKSTGELYQATGTIWHCGSKLCPNCISIFAKNHRHRLRDQIKRVQLREKERWHFGTMTIPNPNLSLVATRELVNHAWSLYRKRLLSVSLIRGGAKSEEFTLTANGYHYHLHTLYIAPWHQFQEVRRVWTECVAEAFKFAKIPFVVNNKDGLLSVTIKRVTDLDQVVSEVCKYITKSDSWYKMPSKHLAEVGLVKRWWRMFELFGCMRVCETSKSATSTQDVVSGTILDTKSLSDGTLPSQKLLDIMKAPSNTEAWRLIQARLSLEEFIEFTNRQFCKTIFFRQAQIKHRWPYSKLMRINDQRELELVPEDTREERVTLETVLRRLGVIDNDA